MRLAVCAGPATTGKTSVLRQIVRRLGILAFLPPEGAHRVDAGEGKHIRQREFDPQQAREGPVFHFEQQQIAQYFDGRQPSPR